MREINPDETNLKRAMMITRRNNKKNRIMEIVGLQGVKVGEYDLDKTNEDTKLPYYELIERSVM